MLIMIHSPCCFPVFFFNDTATTEIYTLSLHDALPISGMHPDRSGSVSRARGRTVRQPRQLLLEISRQARLPGNFKKSSEEHTSELQSPDHLVCRLLLEKKKNHFIIS